MKPSACRVENKEILALRSAIKKKKQVGLKLKKEKADREKAEKLAAGARAAEEERKRLLVEKEKKEIDELKKELRAVNLENAKCMDRSQLEFPLLYNTREEVLELVERHGKGRMDLLRQLDDIFRDLVTEEVWDRIGQLMYIWYEEPKSGDPFDAVYGVLYDGYTREREHWDSDDSDGDSDDSDGGNPSFYLLISGKGLMIDDAVEDDWVEFSNDNDKLGHVTIHAK